MDVTSTLSILISLTSLGIVVFREFIQGPRLSSALDQIVTLHVGEPDKKELLVEMLADDATSEKPSPAAEQLLKISSDLRAAASARDRVAVRREIVNIASNPRTPVRYDPTDDQIRRYLKAPRFALAMYLPLIIANSGKRVGHLSSLLLVAESKVNRRKRFVFSAMAEIDPGRFMKRYESKPDADRMAGVFSGVSITPGASVTVHALMVPMLELRGRRISETHLQPGD